MDRECGGGERNFHISRPGERLRPRAINGRGRGSTRWPSAGLRPPAAPAAPDPRANSWRLTPLPAASPTGLSTPPSTEGPRGCPPPLSPPVDPFTFQQPLDDAVDVEFIYIRHRLSTADPPAAAPPPARARDSHLPSHATSRGGGSGCGSSRGGYPPQPRRCLLPPSLSTGTTRRAKWPPTP